NRAVRVDPARRSGRGPTRGPRMREPACPVPRANGGGRPSPRAGCPAPETPSSSPRSPPEVTRRQYLAQLRSGDRTSEFRPQECTTGTLDDRGAGGQIPRRRAPLDVILT